MLQIVWDALVTQSVMGGAVIALIMLVRRLLGGRIGARQMRALWLLAVLRLLLPLEMPNMLLSTPAPQGEPAQVERVQVKIVPAKEQAADVAQTAPEQDAQKEAAQEQVETQAIQGGQSVPSAQSTEAPKEKTLPGVAASSQDRRLIAVCVWLACAVCLGGYIAFVNIRCFGRLAEGADLTEADCPLPVYEADVDGPCLVGIRRPCIYIGRGTARDADIGYALRHELSHWKAHDNFWLLVRNILLAIYWFHPLVWIGARMAENDAEAACDERVIDGMSREEQLAYAETLIRFNAARTNGGRKRGLLKNG